MKTFTTNKSGVSLIVQTRNNSSGQDVAVDIELSAPGVNSNSTFTMLVRIDGDDFKKLQTIFIQDEN